jgi:hypothetical protein
VRYVPVFIFELDRDAAVLLDTHYNARALKDMVIVVQNAAREWVAPGGWCTGGWRLAGVVVGGEAPRPPPYNRNLTADTPTLRDDHPIGMLCGGALLARPVAPPSPPTSRRPKPPTTPPTAPPIPCPPGTSTLRA